MADFSAKHYMIKSEKNAVRAGEEADRAKSYADSIEPETFVKTSGNQTIGGVKTFTSDIIRKSTTVALSTTPSANTFVDYTTIDKNGVPLGLLEYRQLTNGSSGLSLVLRKKGSESSAVWERIGIFQDTNGNFYTSAPAPSASDNSTKIATTAWVNNKLVYDSGDISLSNNTNNVITLPKSLDSASLHRHQIFVLLKPTETLQNFSTSMYLNAQSGYFYEKNNSISGTCGILTGLSTTQIRYKTGNNAIYYAEGSSYIYDWTKFKVRFLIYKI